MLNRLAGHSNTYHTYDFDQAMTGIVEAGYDAVELSAVLGWTEHVDLDAPQSVVRQRLADYGLDLTVLSAHSDLTTPEGIDLGIKAVRWCADYGIPVMNTAIGGHSSQDENQESFLEGVTRLAAAADDAGVDVALEIHGDIMATGAKTLPLLERIGHPRIRVAYDTANCEFYGDTAAVDDIALMVPYLSNVHLKDKVGGAGVWDFPGPGAGHVDFAGILQMLEAGGYSGPCSVEIEFQGEPWPPLEEVTAAMTRSRSHFNELGLG